MVVTCIDDLKRQARRRMPKMFYDYADSGSWTESTYRANEADLQALRLRQRVAVDLSDRSTATTIVGENLSLPVVLAPVGLTGMMHADGEMLSARAAHAFGSQFTLSTLSICSIEDVASATATPFWFQLYVMKDRSYVADLIGRAESAGCSALVVTLDLQVLGQRHKDLKNGLSTPPRPTIRNLLNLATKPAWCLDMLGTRRRSFGNVVGHVKGVEDMSSLSAWVAEQFDLTLSWDDVAWIRSLWPRKLVLKGIMDEEDARHAVAVGADAIVVSNHGGRQLDGAPSTISALPRIVGAVGEEIEVLMDGGVRSGQDVLKAVASGAKGVLLGRAFVYGLGAGGEGGVTKALELIRNELDLTMAFCGHTRIGDVDGQVLIK